jgi:sialidase-1
MGSVARLTDGRLMVAWQKYMASEYGSEDYGVIEIASRFSHDDGRSWQDERVLVRPDLAHDFNVQAPALRRLASGDLLLICLRAHRGGTDTHPESSSSSMELFRSEDDGETFKSVGYLWKHTNGNWMQGGVTSLLQLRSGRLLVPFQFGTGGQFTQHNQVSCMLSDDEGKSWQRASGVIDLPMRGAMEPSVAELPDGELVMSIRTQLGSVFLSHSTDQGETWCLAQTSGLRAPETASCLRCLPGTDHLLLLWVDSAYDPRHHHFGVRTPLCLGFSRDRGRRWTHLGILGHRDEFNFFDMGMDFIDDDTAIITYGVYGPNRKDQSEWRDPEVVDLHAIRFTREWLAERLKRVEGI